MGRHLFTLSLKYMILSEDDPDPGKNEECYTKLIQFLYDKSLSLVIGKAADDGIKTLQISRDHYASQSKPRIIAVYTELTSLTKESEEIVTDYIVRAEKAVTSLRNANEVINNSMRLKGLPEAFRHSKRSTKVVSNISAG